MIKARTIVKWRRSLSPSDPASFRLYPTQVEAAQRLLVPPRTYQRWEETGCPNEVVLLAMAAVSSGVPPYREE